MTNRKNLGLLIILISVGFVLIGFLFSTYDKKIGLFDNVMHSRVVLVETSDCRSIGGPELSCAQPGLSVPYRWLVALGFFGLLTGIYLSKASRQ